MKLYLIGVGPEIEQNLTAEARDKIIQADVVIGAKRLIDRLSPRIQAEKFCEFRPEKIKAILSEKSYRKAAVLFSGDPGFYSGAKGMLELFQKEDIEVLPGISSLQYFSAKIQKPWQDWHLVSAHGKRCRVVSEVMYHKETFFLTGGEITAEEIAKKLMEAGAEGITLWVGENLSGPKERILFGPPERIALEKFENLAVVLAENKNPILRRPISIKDSDFIRYDKVPMTKKEVRSAVLACMELSPNETVWDIGAGTGAVSVCMAMEAYKGSVYAVEKKEEACQLIKQNAEKFFLDNITVIHSKAGNIVYTLPAPDAVFLGGTEGEAERIIRAAQKKNRKVRFVMTGVTTGTIAFMDRLMEDDSLEDMDLLQISVSNVVFLGNSRLMKAQNPVWIWKGRSKR